MHKLYKYNVHNANKKNTCMVKVKRVCEESIKQHTMLIDRPVTGYIILYQFSIKGITGRGFRFRSIFVNM